MGSGGSSGKRKYAFGSDPVAEAAREHDAPDKSDVQKVMRELDSKWPQHAPLHKLKEFNLSSCRLDRLGSGEDVGCTCAWLMSRCKVATRMNFSNCCLDSYTFSAMACYMDQNTRFADLIFRNNPLGGGAGVGNDMLALLDNCDGAKNVHFEECKLDAEVIEAVSEIKLKPHLHCLALSGNGLGGGEEVGENLARLFNQCPEMTRICLSTCRLDGQSLTSLAYGLEPHNSVIEIDLLGNRFGGGEEVGRSIAKILNDCPNTKKLFLADNRLNGEALEGLAETLLEHQGLVNLDLSGELLFEMPIVDEDRCPLNTFAGESAGQALATIISRCPSLKTVDMRTSDFDEAALDGMVGQMGAEVKREAITEFFLTDKEAQLGSKFAKCRLGLAKLQKRCPNAIFYKDFVAEN